MPNSDTLEDVRQAQIELDPHIDPEATEDIVLDSAGDDMSEAVREWRIGRSLKTLLAQVDAAFPNRSRRSDGTIGDGNHKDRRSDHNPHIHDDHGLGVVTALDITHDPAKGCDAGRLAEALSGSRDRRIKYIIWNRRIANASKIGSAPAWAWRVYTGPNPHNHHCHISVRSAEEFYDDTRPWTIGANEVAEAAVSGAAEDDAETLIRNALAAIGGSRSKKLPLLEALVEAQDAIAVLLSRYAEAERAPTIEEGGLEAPPPSFRELRQSYLDVWNACRLNPDRAGIIAFHRSKLLKGRPRYEEVAEKTGAPWWFIGIVHALEASFNFAGHLHNGDPLTARTVQVPKNRPKRWNPPSDWVSSAVDAITHDGNAGLKDWGLAEALFRFERYNGFGYRSRGINSPYLWSFSSNYRKGKFVADGRYDPTSVSKQCGAAVMLKALVDAGDVAIEDLERSESVVLTQAPEDAATGSDAVSFVESAELPPARARTEAAGASATPLNLDRLPSGLVSGNTLTDFSATSSTSVRSSVSMALLFASRVADAAMREGDDEDDWLAAYKTNLRKLGFAVPQAALSISRFKKNGVFVHKAIIPFLTIALGGAGVGPVILAALSNLQEIDKDEPWITLFDRESRKFETREMHFAAVNTDAAESTVRHVVARLKFDQSETNVLFFKITDATAEFESATTTMSVNNGLLEVLEPKLRKRMEAEILDFIAEAKT